jgi:hypothetical protein
MTRHLNTFTTHYHVVSFINGCLNDYDSGPIKTLEDARASLQDYLWSGDGENFHEAGPDRYTDGFSITTIEPCNDTCELDT